MSKHSVKDWHFEIKANVKGRQSAKELLLSQGYTMAIKKENLIINQRWTNKSKIFYQIIIIIAMSVLLLLKKDLEPIWFFSCLILIGFAFFMILVYCLNSTIIFVSKDRIRKVVRPFPTSLDIRIPVKDIIKICCETLSKESNLQRILKLYLKDMKAVNLITVYGTEEAEHLKINIENFLHMATKQQSANIIDQHIKEGKNKQK